MKKAIFAVWVFLCRLFSFLYLWSNGYRYWSYIYRGIWERKYKDVKIATFASLQLLIAFIGGGSKWRSDSWKALFDAVASPQRIYQIFSGAEPVPAHDVDCDDFMSFTVTAINKSLSQGVMVGEKFKKAWCLTVMWIEKKTWKATGHNVTLLEYSTGPERAASTWAYMDYAGPSPERANINDVAELVRKDYAGPDKYVALTWCASHENLKPWITKWG